MDVQTAIVIVALVLSITSIVLTVSVLPKVYGYVKHLVDELGTALLVRRRYRRVKRYILVRFLCTDRGFQQFSDLLRQRIVRLLGPVLKHKCSIDIISYRSGSGYAVLRVRGEAICVVYTLLALSIQHLGKEGAPCIVIPIKTSGLISRLRRRHLKPRPLLPL